MRERVAEEIDRGIERADGVMPAWGSDDCVLWVADILRAATGRDPAADFRGRYSSKEEAYGLIGPRGLAFGIQKRVRRFGWQPMRRGLVAQAEVGDLGIFREPRLALQACVIKLSSRFWVGRGVLGVAYIPNERITVAWSIEP